MSVAAFVGGGYVSVSGYLTGPTARTVVASYFAALERDDAARALSLGAVPAGTRAYLTADVLRDQLSAGTISDVRVLSVTEGQKRAQVSVHYDLRLATGQRTVTDMVSLIKHGRQWRLAQAAVPTTVDLLQASHHAAFAGAAFPAGTVAMFPGALPVTFDTPNLTLDPGGTTTVAFRPVDGSGLIVMPSATGLSTVRSAIGAKLAACLSGASGDPGCPVPGGPGVRAVPGSLRGTLSATGISGLKVQVTDDVDGVLTITGNVDVDGSYTSLDFTNVASAVKSSTILVTIAAHCYASSITTSLAWGTPS